MRYHTSENSAWHRCKNMSSTACVKNTWSWSFPSLLSRRNDLVWVALVCYVGQIRLVEGRNPGQWKYSLCEQGLKNFKFLSGPEKVQNPGQWGVFICSLNKSPGSIRDSERPGRAKSGTAKDPGERSPGQRDATVYSCESLPWQRFLSPE